MDIRERKLDLPQNSLTSNVGWLYFTLEEEIDVNNITNEDKQILIQLYTFPTPASDMVRLNVLLNSVKEILVRDYFVGFFDATKKTRHYCQFSGGGDLYITKRIQPNL